MQFVKNHFYIGTQELIMNLPEKMPMHRWDRKFLQPALPLERNITVELKLTDNLPIAPETACHIGATSYWTENGLEYRSYGIQSDGATPGLISCITQEGDVYLFGTMAWWRNSGEVVHLWYYIHIEELLLRGKALLLHSASILYRDEAILFTAPSGTGKTTQTDLWHQYADEVFDLNGDQTVLQQTKTGWFACGFPTCGSSERCEQGAMPIKAIVVVRQAKRDEVVNLSPAQKVIALYSECTIPAFISQYSEMAMNLLEQLISSVTVVELDCTMKESAVDVLHRYLYGE